MNTLGREVERRACRIVLAASLLALIACSSSGASSTQDLGAMDGASSSTDAADPPSDLGNDAAQPLTGSCMSGMPCGAQISCYADDGTTYRQCSTCTDDGTWDACLSIEATPPADPGCATGMACADDATCGYEDLQIARYCRCEAGVFDCQDQPLEASCSTTTQDCLFPPPGQDERTWWTMCASVETEGTFSSAGVIICERSSGGVTQTGYGVTFSCPAVKPVVGQPCLAEAIGGGVQSGPISTNEYCSCENGASPCTCTCRNIGPNMMPVWLCLP